MGFVRSEAKELSKGLSQLAIDVASFNNATDAEVMQAFQSAIVGNHETVRKIIKCYSGADNWKDYVDFTYSRQGQDVRYALNDTKLRALGWTPQRKFDDEIQAIVTYYKENFIW